MKVEIEIPDPPEGWVFDGFRQAEPGERRWDGGGWMECTFRTVGHYLVCVKAKPLWKPSPELVALFLDGWITRDRSSRVVFHSKKPFREFASWDSEGSQFYLRCVRPEMLPPDSIPWDQSCFKIGDPQE